MDFQTPKNYCDYMTSLVYGNPKTILEPTPGQGNLVNSLATRFPHANITAPLDFYRVQGRFDVIVGNPPFTPMKVGYDILFRCMEMSDQIVMLMPWLTLINSKARTQRIMDYGLFSLHHLPRDVFPGSRVQCLILHLIRGNDRQYFTYKDLGTTQNEAI